jgi:hypothetical protein
MRQRQAAAKPKAVEPPDQAAVFIGEALVFLWREAAHAGLGELAESLSQSISMAAKLAENGCPPRDGQKPVPAARP